MPDPATSPQKAHSPKRQMRADAAANLDRVVAAAEEVFAELGLEVSIEVVAERAGVGLGTIYRRFANKQALIAELVNRLLTDVIAIGERHLDDPCGSGLVNYMHEVCQLLAGNRGAVARLWNDPSSQALVSRSRDVQQQLVDAAKAAGTVRDDLAGEDLAVALWSIHGILDVTKGTDVDAWSRHLYFVLQGFAAPGSAPAALTSAAMTKVIEHN